MMKQVHEIIEGDVIEHHGMMIAVSQVVGHQVIGRAMHTGRERIEHIVGAVEVVEQIESHWSGGVVICKPTEVACYECGTVIDRDDAHDMFVQHAWSSTWEKVCDDDRPRSNCECGGDGCWMCD